jgi:peptide/nickel transport system substrate-binding protein
MIWKRVLPTLGAVAALVGLAACGGGASSPSTATGVKANASFYTGGTPGGTPVSGGTAVIDRAEAPESLDPLVACPPGETDLDLQVFDQLTESLPGPNKEPQPGLAKSWNTSASGLTLTLHIRPGVQFSNGEALTGEDVIYSLERLKQPTACAHYLSTLWTKVSLQAPMTVQIDLKKPTPALIDDLSYMPASIVSKHAVQREGEKQFALHPVGTGPFMISGTTPGNTTVTMVRNPHYWRHGQPYLDKLVWNEVAEANARVLAVRSGSATIATGIPFSQVSTLRKAPGVSLLVEPFSGSAEQVFNDASAPLTQINVRRALSYATPREAIIKSIFAGLGTPSNNVFGDEVKYWDAKVPVFPYDIAKAKEVLKRSSVPNGFDMTITIPSGDPEIAQIASIEQSSWARIGVHAKIQALEPSVAISNVFAGKYQFIILPPEDSVIETYYPDSPSLQAEDYPDSGNKDSGSNYNSPTVTALIRKASTSQSESERAKLFSEIQELVNFKEEGYLSIAFVPSLTLVSDSLRGFEVPPTGYYRMERAWIAK